MENLPPEDYTHLGPYSDLVRAAERSYGPMPVAAPGPQTREAVRRCLDFAPGPEIAGDVQVEGRWEKDGIAGEALSWTVGYGPRTQAWLLRPAGKDGALPGVVALHDHSGFKYFGKEKIADGPEALPAVVQTLRSSLYGGRTFANALAREGFAVLVPDVFLWGSRRVPLTTMRGEQESDQEIGDLTRIINLYNQVAISHEHIVEKYCRVLGTTLAGVISFEDRIAAHYLQSRSDVQPGGIGCIGLSGGGLRAGLLQATCDAVRASVVVGMMASYAGQLDHAIACHTWGFFPSGWARHGDWPDLVACRAPSSLLVQYDTEDDLFTPEGMAAAHHRLQEHYQSVGAADQYIGQFYPGPHKFDLAMQEAAFQWLRERLVR